MRYWNQNGRYQKTYDYLWNKLVPASGKCNTPEGELLRNISKIYYRHYNDGDSYSNLIDEGMTIPITNIKGLDKEVMKKIMNDLEYDTDKKLEIAVNNALQYIMLKLSPRGKIWNPDTNRLVEINTTNGLKSLEKLDCSVIYQSNNF